MPEPFVITVSGKAEIPKPAERAIINVVVSSSGTNKQAVSEEVMTTSKHVESLLREMAPKDESVEAKQASPLAHWSKKSMTATSHVPYHNHDKPAPSRIYDCSVNFDIRFKEFKALGSFGEKLSALSHVEVRNIQWALAPGTEKTFHSRLRKEAAQDALQKARDYCEVLGCTNLRPVDLSEGGMAPTFGNARMAQMQQMQVQQPYGPGGNGNRDESPLEFRPEEVRMSMEVTVKFHAE
jgi:uncharacterized protein YggE